jgi:hypothetical protein
MSDECINRRDFARGLMAGGSCVAVALTGTAAALGDESTKQNQPAPATPPTPQPAEPPRREPPEEAYLLGLVLKRYPDERLDDRAIGDILQDIRSDISRSRALNAFPLRNSDEPGFVFRAWRTDD